MSSFNPAVESERADTRVQRAFNPIEDGATQKIDLLATAEDITLEPGQLYKFWGSVKFHLVFDAAVDAAVASHHPHNEAEDHYYYSIKHTRASCIKYTSEADGSLWVTKQPIR